MTMLSKVGGVAMKNAQAIAGVSVLEELYRVSEVDLYTVIDDFNDTNGNLEDHTPNLDSESGGWLTTTATEWTIASNQVSFSGTSGEDAARVATALANVQLRVQTTDTGKHSLANNFASTSSFWNVDKTNGTSGDLEIWDYSGSYSLRGSDSFTGGTAGDWIIVATDGDYVYARLVSSDLATSRANCSGYESSRSAKTSVNHGFLETTSSDFDNLYIHAANRDAAT